MTKYRVSNISRSDAIRPRPEAPQVFTAESFDAAAALWCRTAQAGYRRDDRSWVYQAHGAVVLVERIAEDSAPVACEHDHEEGAERTCGEPATHSGYVPFVSGRVPVCPQHLDAAVQRGDLTHVLPLPARAPAS
jgi:hypothetical protein